MPYKLKDSVTDAEMIKLGYKVEKICYSKVLDEETIVYIYKKDGNIVVNVSCIDDWTGQRCSNDYICDDEDIKDLITAGLVEEIEDK